MNNNIFSNIVSITSLVISLFVLFLHIKNTKVSSKVYFINRDLYRSSSSELLFVCSKQLENSFIINFVLFNPGQIAEILQSFTVFKRVHPHNFFYRLFNIRKWEEITEAKWWPTSNSNCYAVKSVEDEYMNLFVKDRRDIMVSIPGCIDFVLYKFSVKTNNREIILYESINGGRHFFPHYYKKWYK